MKIQYINGNYCDTDKNERLTVLALCYRALERCLEDNAGAGVYHLVRISKAIIAEN